ncbi:hypothetical protein Lnau_1269 [Legionella nautarum]|uniref:Secreted protein n=2 Tax=Legionella nautarum TaxID=45070 RepID=A0A0W0WVD9_9GAMM|nr:hypothetical protein [Legionella nautarum]KTD36285.1 hypothetical protein Lnau_1269 [Legionella nautarum]
MRLFSRLISILLIYSAVISLHAATTNSSGSCPDLKGLEAIITELDVIITQEVCTKNVKPENIQWLARALLPKLMNKTFLGVEPPPFWQSITNEIITNCYTKGNLCTDKIQSNFESCLMEKFPTVIWQLGLWLAENCDALNNNIVMNWNQKKLVVKGIISAFIAKL